MKKNIVAVSLALLLSSSFAVAMDHSKMNHADMDHSEMATMSDMTTKNMTQGNHTADHKKMEGEGKGVIHRVSKLNRTVNITHAPIAALNWPKMTMDLEVVDGVDLNSIKPEDTVTFHIVLDEDKVYRIHHIVKK